MDASRAARLFRCDLFFPADAPLLDPDSRLLDGTLSEPFFARMPGGSLRHASEAPQLVAPRGSLQELPDDRAWLGGAYDAGNRSGGESETASESDSDGGGGCGGDGDADGGERPSDAGAPTDSAAAWPAATAALAEADRGGRGARRARVEIDARAFVRQIWPKLVATNRAGTKHLSPSAVWLEILSFIKGSNAALESDERRLSREEYLRLGAKMAPAFQGVRGSEAGVAAEAVRAPPPRRTARAPHEELGQQRPCAA